MSVATGINIIQLPDGAANKLGMTHKVIIDYTAFTSTAATSKILYVNPYSTDGSDTFAAGHVAVAACYDLETTFDGASTSNLQVKIGDGTTDDSLLANTQIHEDATEVTQAFTPWATKSPAVYTAANKILITFTEAAQNLSTLTAGKIHIYFKLVDLTAFRKIGQANN